MKSSRKCRGTSPASDSHYRTEVVNLRLVFFYIPNIVVVTGRDLVWRDWLYSASALSKIKFCLSSLSSPSLESSVLPLHLMLHRASPLYGAESASGAAAAHKQSAEMLVASAQSHPSGP